MTAGMKHIKFWTQTGGGFTSKRGTFGDAGRNETMMCATYGKVSELLYSGGASGKVYVWKGNILQNAVQAHEGPVFAMQVLEKVIKLCTCSALTKLQCGDIRESIDFCWLYFLLLTRWKNTESSSFD